MLVTVHLSLQPSTLQSKCIWAVVVSGCLINRPIRAPGVLVIPTARFTSHAILVASPTPLSWEGL